ncbi:hypothetical protein BDD12DRAFT_46950 [Trichophaea hybrida]|nr:hypothetical protein BDD12DRAFT_46950 [Trichophaea hybrida]
MQNLPCSEPQRAPRTKATNIRRTIRVQSSQSEEPTEVAHQTLGVSSRNLSPSRSNQTIAGRDVRTMLDMVSSITEGVALPQRRSGIHPDAMKDFADVQAFVDQHKDGNEYPDWVIRECVKRLKMLKQLAHCVIAGRLRERSTEAIDISEKVAITLVTRHQYLEAEKLYRNMISLLLFTPQNRHVLWHWDNTMLETLVSDFASMLETNGEVAAAIELYEDLFAF